MEFGERTQDCSPGHRAKEGPHLVRTGASRGYSISTSTYLLLKYQLPALWPMSKHCFWLSGVECQKIFG